LKNRNIADYIPHRNYKTKRNGLTISKHYNKTRFAVERFFAWLKNGFHRTKILYERIADNYLAFLNIASIMVYWRVLGELNRNFSPKLERRELYVQLISKLRFSV